MGVLTVVATVAALVAGATPSPAYAGTAVQPTLTAIGPRSGPVDGYTEVRLVGTGFDAATKVWFGGVPASSIEVRSPERILVETPVHAAATVAVRVGRGVPTSVPTSRTKFTYVVDDETRPRVRSLSPARGPVAGGTRVTVTGIGLSRTVRVTFGGVEGTDLVVASDASLQVTSPARARGVTSVRVFTAGEGSDSGWGSFFTHEDDGRAVIAMPPSRAERDDPKTELHDVACGAPGVCVAVGMYDDYLDRRVPLAEVLRNGTWTTEALAVPAGPRIERVTHTNVTQVECPAVSTCIAVGTWVDGTSARPLVHRWDGARWTARALGGAGGVTVPLDQLACGGPTACVALGQTCLVGTGCTVAAFALDGTTWTRTPVALPPGVPEIWVSDVACVSPTACVAVGRTILRTDSSKPRLPVVLRYDGNRWTATVTTTLPPDAIEVEQQAGLDEVECFADGCRALGYYRGPRGGYRLYLSTLTTAGETLTALGYPAGTDGTYFYWSGDLSCADFGSCRGGAAFRRTGQPSSDLQFTVTAGVVTVAPPEADPLRVLNGDLLCASASGCLGLSRGRVVQLPTGGTPTYLPGPVALAPTDPYPSDDERGVDCPAGLTHLIADSPTTAVGIGSCSGGGALHGVLVTGIPLPAP